MPAALRDVVGVVEHRYDPRWAESWDAVGLVCGDPDAPVSKVLFAIDPVAEVVDEALAWGADLLVTHHPLFLRAVHGVPATDHKGRLVHRLIGGGCGLLVAHTNADCATGGVSDALADALKLPPGKPIDPRPCDPVDKLVTFVPQADADRVLDALAIAGAGAIGDYDRCAFTVAGTGTFHPLAGAHPTIGTVGEVATVAETRLEMVMSRDRRDAVVAALRAAHPYEEPAFDVIEVAGEVGMRGTGRVCVLDEAEPLSEFVNRVARGLPATAGGIRVAGEATRLVRRIAVCGGAGDSLLDSVRAIGADVYVTADLRHHPASEAREASGGTALVDVAHWASEWPWLARAAEELEAGLNTARTRVQTRVSELVTDPWRFRA
ncbi:MAG TPA: Nif3-like dinuclear metal center hexameric protein [Sporichthya sp.]|nr:Nif3-like dinuclear metal center hexameric protein [Sporichthya sp.]